MHYDHFSTQSVKPKTLIIKTMETTEEKISRFDLSTRMKMKAVISALDDGNVESIEFMSDGTGVRFAFWLTSADLMQYSFSMEVALIILAGHRLRSHERPKCF